MKEAVLFLVCLGPLFKLVWAGFHAGLGVNPVEFVEHATGDWTLRFFMLTLAVTPLVRLSGWSWWAKRRRMLGLFVAFYAALHFTTYFWLDAGLSVTEALHDVAKRPYICVGFSALVLLIPLAATSTDAMIRRLKRWWVRIHWLIYPAAILGVVHYLWLVKRDKTRPLEYAAVLSALLLFRVVWYLRARLRTASVAAVLLALCMAPCSAGSPVVIELFTSQGCSSCPDADVLLARWGGARFKDGTVIPLSYSVDYWNYLGWKDIFSAPAFSERQRSYAAALGVGVYTPQAVVAGAAALVGSDEVRLKEAFERLRQEPDQARVAITASPSPRVKLSITAAAVAPGGKERHVMLALFESGLSTQIKAGENAGGTLRNDFVVRRLVDLGRLPADGKELRRSFEDPWDSRWRKEMAGAAVFVQETGTMRIVGAASVYPLAR
jgi:sulfoxide reductase heme-binding subunit YedZ